MKVHTSITSWLYYFQPTVVIYRDKMIKTVSEYVWTKLGLIDLISIYVCQKHSVVVTKYVQLNWSSELLCFLHYAAFAVFMTSFFIRGPWRASWSFLRLLCRAVPWRHVCGDFTKEDPVLRSQPPGPLHAPLFHDPAGLLTACQLRGEDQLGWEVITGGWNGGGWGMVLNERRGGASPLRSNILIAHYSS